MEIHLSVPSTSPSYLEHQIKWLGWMRGIFLISFFYTKVPIYWAKLAVFKYQGILEISEDRRIWGRALGNATVQRELWLLSLDMGLSWIVNGTWTCLRERKKQEGMWEVVGNRTSISKRNWQMLGSKTLLGVNLSGSQWNNTDRKTYNNRS